MGAGNADLSPFRRVLDRVVDQVVEDLPDRFLVRHDQGLAAQAAGIERERQVLGLRSSPVPFEARFEHGDQAQRAMLEELLAGIEPGQAEHVQDQLVQPVRLLVDSLQEAAVDRLIVEGPVEQGFRVRLDRGERRLELVGRIGHEVLPHPFQPAEVGHVVKDEHGPRRRRSRQGSSSNREDSGLAPQRGLAKRKCQLALISVRVREPEGLLDGVLHLGTADQFRHQPPDRGGIEAEERIGAGVGEDQPPARVDRDDGLGHGPQHDA